jgi:hypothetical protein
MPADIYTAIDSELENLIVNGQIEAVDYWRIKNGAMFELRYGAGTQGEPTSPNG